jgi:hypothetical protein
MDLQELINLITVRGYVVNSVNNASIDRGTVNTLNNILILLDKKIVGILTDTEFKEYVGYADVRKAIEDVVRITNIKSGIKK